MTSGAVTTERVDYLQRYVQPATAVGGPATAGAPDTRRLLRVRGIGRPAKDGPQRARLPDERWRPPTTDLVTGLYGYRIPFAFSLSGGHDGVHVRLGTWSSRPGAEGQDRRRDVVAAVLRGLYPAVDLQPAADESWAWPLSGLALGIPGPTGVEEADGSAPVDRIIRSLVGTPWSVLVLAFPVAESAVAGIRAEVLNEMRAVQAAVRAEGAPSPLAEQYVDLLDTTLGSLGEGLATGTWRTAVYLLGDGESYPRLATVWRSVFSGERSLPEPVRVLDRPEVSPLAQQWAMPDVHGLPGPGLYQRPFEFQTLLTTAQLAWYAHLPELETPGFSVDLAPRFDTVPADPAAAEGLPVGRIQHNKRDTGVQYRAPLRSLTRHVFVAGTTGSGKTNTILGLLSAADAAGVPFLVIEPAKKEYRGLIAHPVLGPRMRVFTAGQAGVAPLLLNPFEVPAGTSVSEHLDLVRSAFAAAFGMWTPLPQILERCLHEVYVDRGWDLRTNANSRLAPGEYAVEAYPTLGDLVTKVAEVIPTLGYEDKVTGDLRAALTTRLESLRTGGKGAMLDVARSLPVEELLGQPTVVELEAMGDEGDRAFLAALLLIRVAEHRRAQGQRDDLVHLLVVEEAHRLLANVTVQAAEEAANPRGQAVETFANLLSEIRAYGQGVVIADQIPVRLAPDVVKNTTLKIAHRLVSADDRIAMGGAMAMEEPQTRALTTLAVGEAAVFGAGDDSPLLVRIPLVKNALAATTPPDELVAAHMARWRAAAGLGGLFVPRPFCVETCRDAPDACASARRLIADDYVQRTFARIVLSTIEEGDALDRLWPDLVDALRARRSHRVDESRLLHAFAGHAADWYAHRRGAQNAWSYADTTELRRRLLDVLLDRLDGGRAAAQVRPELQAVARRLHARTYPPYPACEFTCKQQPPLCLYRAAVADLVTSRRYQPSWREADAADARSADNRRRQTWEVCQDAAYELVEFPEPDGDPAVTAQVVAAAKRVCMCFEQQMLADDERKVPRTSRRILLRVLDEAGL